MNAMEIKICERCCDYFSRRIGSEISECLNCKSEIYGDEVEKLPTKKEVTERLQKACDVINNGGCFLYVKAHKSNGRMACYNNGIQIGHSIKYRPEPKPPEKNALIIYVDQIRGNLELMYGFSAGIFVNGPESTLCITKKYNRETAFDKWDMTTNQWYCPSTGQKVNWRDEWTPEEFRK